MKSKKNTFQVIAFFVSCCLFIFFNVNLVSAKSALVKNSIVSEISKQEPNTAKSEKKVIIKFNAGKGTCNVSSKKYTYGREFESLPSAKRSKYSFLGWYTKPSGGDKIYIDDFCMKSKTTTVYAHYKNLQSIQTSINSAKSTKGVMKVTWKKSKYAYRYQLCIAGDKNFNAVRKVVLKNTSVGVSGAIKGTRYYFKVRTISKDSKGNNCYGKWSSVKSVMVK